MAAFIDSFSAATEESVTESDSLYWSGSTKLAVIFLFSSGVSFAAFIDSFSAGTEESVKEADYLYLSASTKLASIELFLLARCFQ